MSENHAITIRVDTKKSDLLNTLSEEYNRSKNFLINEALESYLEEEEIHLNQLKDSIQQADSGQTYNNNDVKLELLDLVSSKNGD